MAQVRLPEGMLGIVGPLDSAQAPSAVVDFS